MATKKAAKKTAAKKSAAKKSTAKKAAKKPAARKTTKYGPAASKQVQTDLHEMHHGQLKMGRSGKKVTDPKQAIAIALSQARKKGGKVPPNPNEK